MIKDKIRLIDITALILIGICYLPALIFRMFNRNIWLCSERKNEARDNGYWMYKFIRENHQEQKCYYVISKKSFDRKKVEQYKTIINWGSLRHYFIFIATRIRLSAHVDSDTPNFRVTNFLERHHILKNKRVFLQHGITKDKISFGYYTISKADLFICGAVPEYAFCKKEFGYPDGNVVLTGFARYDGLKNNNVQKQILIMPTWRAWLKSADEEEFKNSDYFKQYNSLLNNQKLIELLNKNDCKLTFFVHPDMQKYNHLFISEEANIIIADSTKNDVQALLNSSSLLITDYSSVAFDFAFLKKPLAYYWFDYDTYRSNQHPVGYFDYNNDGFGPILKKEDDLIMFIENAILNKFSTKSTFMKRVDNFFKFYDNNNCARIYHEIERKLH